MATFNALFNLSSLDGSNGFVINGINQFDSSGNSVSNAGDVNGDGIGDLIIGAVGANNYAGRSYVVFGKSTGFSASLNLSTLDGSNGFVINGINANDRLGSSVSNAGDVNGDGIGDFIIGAFGANNFAGRSYVVFGKSTGFSASLNLSTLDGSNGFVINGINANDYSGRSVSNAGDVNGDGIGDLIIGGDGANNFAGKSYVVFGKSTGFSASLNLSTLDGSNGFVINGINANDYSGYSVSNAGDVNGDGIGDLIIGAQGANGAAGKSYVVFGKSTGFSASLNLSSLNGSNGFAIDGIKANDFSGFSVSNAGDVNGDGIADLIIGAPGTNGAAGQSYVVFGKSTGFSASLNLSTLNGSNGFVINGINQYPSFGRSVSNAGDVNGDGIGDLIISAVGPNGGAERSYVMFGKSTGFSASLNLSTLDGSNGFAIDGINQFDFFGNSVSNAGDVNGDGIGDLIIGAFGANQITGKSYVVFGVGAAKPTVTLAAIDPNAAEANQDPGTFRITRTGYTTSPLTVGYTVMNGLGMAMNGADYTPPLTGTATIAAGQSFVDITITPVDDTVPEQAEAVILTLNSSADYTMGANSSAIVTIADNDPSGLPVVRIAAFDLNAAEKLPSEVQDPGTFRISRVGDPTNPLTVSYTISGTASSSDYTPPLTGTATIPAGQSFIDFSITPVDDAIAEGTETLTLTLVSSANYALDAPATTTATVTIVDNEIAPNINPIANPDSITTPEDQAITFYVLGNDTDPDGDTITVTGSTSPSNGTLVNLSKGIFSYTPALNFNGTDSFNYTISDGKGGTATATVGITVTPVNDPAVITGISTGVVTEDATPNTVTGTLTATDVDSPATFVAQTNTNGIYGSFTITSSGDWIYSLDNSRAATDALVGGQTVSDVFTAATADGTTKAIAITINGSDDPTSDPNSNVILGTNGNDNLVGTSNDDEIQGLAGNDTLNGGLGADMLIGGTGNDTYIVDAEDEIEENPGEGIDLVRSNISWSLQPNVENLTLTGTANISGTGNELANAIAGNSGNNNLNGGAGNDILEGGAGADTLRGGTGNDTLIGGAGNDNLGGGTGNDLFVYTSFSDRTDVITDFNTSQDKLDLKGLNLGANPVANGFLRFSQSGANTLIQIDTDGIGTVSTFSTLVTLNSVTATNLVVGTNVLVV
ncbi:beta strand repeat-containing protein [Aerosakkonemataceae cyanobacterium BLCC-F50]|uniref:Beta strand repeat-containing protein n=1 Tax=Floridaenema flaviceps BLCC-F50 TaxID=3153642 RepID=A0ABV4XMT2_9CYAN